MKNVCTICRNPQAFLNNNATTIWPWTPHRSVSPMCAPGDHVFVPEDVFWARMKSEIAACL